MTMRDSAGRRMTFRPTADEQAKLAELSACFITMQKTDEDVLRLVGALRASAVPWRVIGMQLDLSAQAVQQRYGSAL